MKNKVAVIGEPVLYYNQYCTKCHFSFVGKQRIEPCLICKKADEVVSAIPKEASNVSSI